MKALKHFALIIAAAALLCASCEPETEDPPGASVTFPQITLVNNSPSTAFLLGFDSSGNRIITTGDVAPYTSAQAKFRKSNINPAGEYARIEVWKMEDSASDTKLYEDLLTLHPRDRYTYTVDKDYNVHRHY